MYVSYFLFQFHTNTHEPISVWLYLPYMDTYVTCTINILLLYVFGPHNFFYKVNTKNKHEQKISSGNIA